MTLCGMASGLAAFFGQPIAGAFFALEVVHRYGLEYYEALVPAIASGTACTLIFRILCRFKDEVVGPFGSDDHHLGFALACLGYGVPVGFFGGAIGGLWCLMLDLTRSKLKNFTNLPLRGLTGGLLIGLCTIAAPASAFWGEIEIRSVLEGGVSPSLPHAPQAVSSIILPWASFLADLDQPLGLLWVGLLKLVATFVTVLAGYRGGYIFPLQHAGIALGLGVAKAIDVDPVATALLSATAVCVPATRCVFAVPFVVSALANRYDLLPAAIVSSIVSLLLTSRVAVIAAARSRTTLS